MKGFIIKKGTPVLAVKRENGELVVEPVVTKKEVCYVLEDLLIDPLFSVKPLDAETKNPNDLKFENHFASRGFFGFKLEANSKGYEMLICHGKNINK